jgi:hypothetical protein
MSGAFVDFVPEARSPALSTSSIVTVGLARRATPAAGLPHGLN